MPSLFKNVLLILIFLSCFFNEMSGSTTFIIDHSPQEGEAEITGVVRGAVKDTRWLEAASRQEVQQLLSTYYSGQFLSDLSDSAWNFISVPTDWDYETQAGQCTVLSQSEDQASIQVEILETNVLSGVVYVHWAEYRLIKENGAWKIIAVNCAP